MNAQEQMTYCSSVTLLFFEASHCALSAKELEVLTNWLGAWRTMPRGKKFMVGGALETPRVGRLRRLRSVLNVLETAGVTSRMILPLEVWSAPTKMGLVDSLPADVAWIGCRDSQMVASANGKHQLPTGIYCLG